MSSRKSSRVSSPSSLQTDKVANATRDLIQNIMIIVFILSVIVQCSVLYYLYNLEDADCNCIRDWRHNFCKAFALLVIATGVILLAFQHLSKGFMIAYYIGGLVNVYAFFTYVGDLNATQCTCAVSKQSNLNSVMRAYRWLLLIGGVSTAMQLLALLGIGGHSVATAGSR